MIRRSRPCSRPRRRRARAAVAAALVAGALGLHPTGAEAGQGQGNPSLRVSTPSIPADRVTDVTVTGTDYLVPPHAPGQSVFGGIYVFFGWVANPGRFGPSIRNSTSADGTFAVTYAYPGDGGDPGQRDPGTGVMRLVSFTPGGESGTATAFHMDDHGNWSVRVRIYGSTFTSTNPVTGEERSFDCRKVQCGIFTVGAHGKASATNERFVPLTFTGASKPTPPPATVPPSAPTAPGGAGGSGGTGSGGVPPGGSGVGVDPGPGGGAVGPDGAVVADPLGPAAPGDRPAGATDDPARLGTRTLDGAPAGSAGAAAATRTPAAARVQDADGAIALGATRTTTSGPGGLAVALGAVLAVAVVAGLVTAAGRLRRRRPSVDPIPG